MTMKSPGSVRIFLAIFLGIVFSLGLLALTALWRPPEEKKLPLVPPPDSTERETPIFDGGFSEPESTSGPENGPPDSETGTPSADQSRDSGKTEETPTISTPKNQPEKDAADTNIPEEALEGENGKAPGAEPGT